MADYAPDIAPETPAKPDSAAPKMSADEEKAFLEVALARFKTAVDAEDDNRTSQLDDMKFRAASSDNGFAWPTDIKQARENDPYGARPCLTINKLPQHVNQVTNEQRQNRPSVKVLPVDDQSDTEVAEIMNGIVRHIHYNSDAEIAFDTACDNQVGHGLGFFRVITDYTDENSFEQDIFVRRIRNSFSVYMDPAIQCPAGSDQEWCFITEQLTKPEFKEKYPNAKPIDWEGGAGDEWADWLDGEGVRIAEYFCFKNEQKKLYLFADGRTMLEGDPALEVMMALEEPVRSRMTTIKRVQWHKITVGQILDTREWAGKYIPVVRVVGNEFDINGKLHVSGLVRNGKDPSRVYNYLVSTQAEQVGLANKAPFIGYEGQFEGHENDWGRANTVNIPYLQVKSVTDESTGNLLPLPQRQPPLQQSTALLTAMQVANDDLKAVTGQYDASLGQRSNETSGVAIRQRQKEGDVGTFHYLDNLATAIRHGGRIQIDLIPKVYDTKRIARIIGEDSQPDKVQLDPKQQVAVLKSRDPQTAAIKKIYNLNLGKYDVAVTVGPSYTTKKQEAAESMAQILQGAPQLWMIVGDLLVKNMDWSGAEEMAKRMKVALDPRVLQLIQQEEKGDDSIPPQVQAQLTQAAQQVQQLQQAVQQAAGAVAERDQKIQQLEQQAQGKVQEGEIRLRETEIKSEAEIEKARASVEIARLKVQEVSSQAPADNGQAMELVNLLAGLVTALAGNRGADPAMIQQIAESINGIATAMAQPKVKRGVMTENPDGSFSVESQEQAA